MNKLLQVFVVFIRSKNPAVSNSRVFKINYLEGRLRQR